MTAATQPIPAGSGDPGPAGRAESTGADGADGQAGLTGQGGAARQDGRNGRGAAGRWHQWRAPLMIIGLVVLAGIVIALLQPPPSASYLDPASTAALGTHALADILEQRGQHVSIASTPATAAASAGPGSTLVITSPQYLAAGQLASLARVRASLVIVQPDQAAVNALAPHVALAGRQAAGVLPPACRLRAADLAGPADMGGISFAVTGGLARMTGCYPAGGQPTLVQFPVGRRLTTLLGSGLPLTNEYLARQGDAALAINLLSSARRVVWLVPAPTAAATAAAPRSFTSLIPLPARLVAIQLAVAVLLAALWRARRLGPLISEELPVVVRASETTEGHARLYRSRRARDRAATALRAAALNRLTPAAELPRGAAPAEVTGALAARSALAEERISALLYGTAPDSDAKLVSLADDLDALEGEVRKQ